MTKNVYRSTGKASSAMPNALRRRLNFSKCRNVFRIRSTGTMHMRTVHCRLPSSRSGSTRPTAARRSNGAAAAKSMTLEALQKNSQRLGQTARRTSTSNAKAASKAVSRTAAGRPPSSGVPFCRSVTICMTVATTLDKMTPIMHLTYNRAHRLDSGISKKFHTRVVLSLRLKCDRTLTMSEEQISGVTRVLARLLEALEPASTTGPQALCAAADSQLSLAEVTRLSAERGDRAESLESTVGGVLDPSAGDNCTQLPNELDVERRGEIRGGNGRLGCCESDCNEGRRNGRKLKPAACKRFIFTSMLES
mmetsp:Transcript_122832/g.342268  ORF Transcript_122832/g.342268 Transcript_122832/m.342268 type:complete len:307 (+) Transcript_122832:665-1585(+)